jgi:hypothetical protein
MGSVRMGTGLAAAIASRSLTHSMLVAHRFSLTMVGTAILSVVIARRAMRRECRRMAKGDFNCYDVAMDVRKRGMERRG